jgi:hypothetical protein
MIEGSGVGSGSGSIPLTSVADQGCLSRIPDPDFYPSRILDLGSRIPDLGSRISDPGSRISDPGSRIPDPGSRIPDPKTGRKERGEKKIVVKYFFVATNFTKCKIINFLTAQEKNLGQISKNYGTFYPNNCH